MKLWTLARKRWIVRWNLQTCSLPEGISCFEVSFSYRVGLDKFAFLKFSISICEGRTRTEQDTGKYYKKGKMYQKLKIKDLYFHFVLWYITKKFYKDIYLQFLESCTVFTSNYCFCVFLHIFLHRNSYNLSTSLYDKANVVAPINLDWQIYSRINYIWLTYKWHTNDMRVHATLILMAYEYVRVIYGQYMDDIRVHTSGIWMPYE